MRDVGTKAGLATAAIVVGAAAAGVAGVGEPPREGVVVRRVARPVITEVLFAVPTYEGDANGDGSRHAIGDEFVELWNPGEEALALKGWTLIDRNPPGQGQLRFTFPELELGPGEVVVVFNGLEQRWRGPVGDARRAPPGRNELFGGAWVFTMGNESALTGFGNGGDWVALLSPSGSCVQCVRWGRVEEPPPIEEERVQDVGDIFGESAVLGPEGTFVGHRSLAGEAGEHRFSPGRHWQEEE